MTTEKIWIIATFPDEEPRFRGWALPRDEHGVQVPSSMPLRRVTDLLWSSRLVREEMRHIERDEVSSEPYYFVPQRQFRYVAIYADDGARIVDLDVPVASLRINKIKLYRDEPSND